MQKPEVQKPFLDRPAARLLAVLVILFCGALLAYVHRDDVKSLAGNAGEEEAVGASDDPAAPCIEQRFAEIDGMIEEGVVDAEQAALFRQRAEAMCRATEGSDNASPLPAN